MENPQSLRINELSNSKQYWAKIKHNYNEMQGAIIAASDVTTATLNMKKNTASTIGFLFKSQKPNQLRDQLGFLIADLAHNRTHGGRKSIQSQPGITHKKIAPKLSEAISPEHIEPQHEVQKTNAEMQTDEIVTIAPVPVLQQQKCICALCNNIFDVTTSQQQLIVYFEELLNNQFFDQLKCITIDDKTINTEHIDDVQNQVNNIIKSDKGKRKNSNLKKVICIKCLIKLLETKSQQQVTDLEQEIEKNKNNFDKNVQDIQNMNLKQINNGDEALLFLQNSLIQIKTCCTCCNERYCQCGCGYFLHDHGCECDECLRQNKHQTHDCVFKEQELNQVMYNKNRIFHKQRQMKQDIQKYKNEGTLFKLSGIDQEIQFFYSEFPFLKQQNESLIMQNYQDYAYLFENTKGIDQLVAQQFQQQKQIEQSNISTQAEDDLGILNLPDSNKSYEIDYIKTSSFQTPHDIQTTLLQKSKRFNQVWNQQILKIE